MMIVSNSSWVIMPYHSVKSYILQNRGFHSAIKHKVEQGRKAMSLLKKIRSLKLPIDLKIKLFEHTIDTILLCGLPKYTNHKKST